MYHKGTLSDFNKWHEAVKVDEGIPPDGRIGFVNGKPAPNNQRTMHYSMPVKHPRDTDSYVWLHGDHADRKKTKLTKEKAKTDGWFSEDEEKSTSR